MNKKDILKSVYDDFFGIDKIAKDNELLSEEIKKLNFRIYLNKCNNKVDCYDNTTILKRLQNIKFRVTYSSLNTKIFKFE